MIKKFIFSFFLIIYFSKSIYTYEEPTFYKLDFFYASLSAMQKNTQNSKKFDFSQAFSILEEGRGFTLLSIRRINRIRVFLDRRTRRFPGFRRKWASFNTVLPPAPLLVSSRKQSVISRLNHSFADPPYRSVGPYIFTVSGNVLLSYSLSSNFYAGVFARGNVAYVLLGYEYSADGYSHIQGFIRFVSQKTFKSAVKLLSGPMPNVHCQPSRDPSGAITYCKKGGSWEEKGNIPCFLSHQTQPRGVRRVGLHENIEECLPSNDASTQTSPMVPAPSILLSSDQKNMDLSCPSQDMQQLIASDLGPAQVLFCVGPHRSGKKLRRFKQCVRDWLSDTTLSAPVTAGFDGL